MINCTKLDYRGFESHLVRDDNQFDGFYLFKFENNYGASVMKHFGCYGGKSLFELAIVKFNGNRCEFTFTDDALGYLSNQKVLEILEKIKNI